MFYLSLFFLKAKKYSTNAVHNNNKKSGTPALTTMEDVGAIITHMQGTGIGTSCMTSRYD